jgi:hypothetical protein
MRKLTFKVGGRTFSNSRDAMRELGKQVQKKANTMIGDHVRRHRCPIHGEYPREIGRDSSGIKYSFCCDGLRNTVARSLR